MIFWLQGLLVKTNFSGILVLPSEHKLSFLGDRLLTSRPTSNILLKLLHSVCIPQRVKRMLTGGLAWANVRNHGCLTVSSERIFEDLG